MIGGPNWTSLNWLENRDFDALKWPGSFIFRYIQVSYENPAGAGFRQLYCCIWIWENNRGGIRALPGSDTDPLDYIFIGGFVFAFIRRALMVRVLLRPKGRLPCTVKERPQQQKQQEKIEGAQGKLLTRVAQELKVAENPKLLDLRDHTALFVPFFPVILTLFCFFFLSSTAAAARGLFRFFCYFLSLFFIFYFFLLELSVQLRHGRHWLPFICVNRTVEYACFQQHPARSFTGPDGSFL